MKSMLTQPFVTAACLALAATLSGCGGGGDGNTRMDTDTEMTGGEQTLTVPEGLMQSTLAPLFYTGADQDTMTIPVVSSGIRRDYDQQLSEHANDASIKSFRFDDYDNEDDPHTLEVTYVVGGDEVTIRFTDDDLNDPTIPYDWEKTADGVVYWGWLYQGNSEEQDGSISFIGGIPNYRLYATGGFRTETADLPTGTAMYEGAMRGDSHLTNDPSAGRLSMRGSLRLTADFDEGSLEGRISEIAVRPDDPKVWSNLPNTTYFAIDDGQIVDGQFTASVTGMDSNANAPMSETVRGYEGGVLGEFYGPEAAEVGGVLNASRDDRVMSGVFGGVKQQ